METIKKFTNGLLNYSETKLFLLFLVTGITYYSTESPGLEALVGLLNIVGGLFFLGWLYAIGHKAKEKLDRKNINSTLLKYFDFYFLALLVSAIVMLYLSNGAKIIESGDSNFHFSVTYTEPSIFSLVFFASLILIILTTAKSLVSAEKIKDAGFGEYFTTILLFVFSFIGVWFIQPRAQQL